MAVTQTQRPQFYEEQYLGATDLTAAVDYGRIQQARHLLGAHTWGIAIGLQLIEAPRPGGGVTVHLLPGYAWDGYGRPIIVLAPYKIPEEKFSSIKFDPSIDTDVKGRLTEIWLRYDELATRPQRPGFEVCDRSDQLARIEETFRIEIGDRPGPEDRYSGLTIASRSVADAKTSLKVFDHSAPEIYDESIPHQALPEPEDRARWLIPVGYVRWLPVENQAGHFVARDDSGTGGTEKDSDKIRRVRRYIGVVAEEIGAADGTIRLRDRGKPPASSFKPPTEDLVWVEGDLRVLGNAKLCAGKLDFRDQEGQDLKAPLRIQRVEDTANGVSALQVAIGRGSSQKHRFAVGPLEADGSVNEGFAVLSDGNVGIGTITPSHKFHVLARDAVGLLESITAEAYLRLATSEGLGNRVEITNRPGGRLSLWTAGGAGDVFNITRDGKVGIGTTNPTQRFHVFGGDDVGLFESSGDHAFLRLMTKEGPDNRVEITNRPGGRFTVWTMDGGDSFNVHQGGNVGIGTTAPVTKLHVLGNRIRLENNNKRVDLRADGSAVDLHSDSNHLYVRSSGPGGNNNVVINPYAVDGNVGIGTELPTEKLHVQGDMRVTGIARGGPWTPISDKRLKKEIAPLTDALGKLLKLRGVRFEWRRPEAMGNQTGLQMGLIAQEVEKVFPEWVAAGPDGYKELTIRGFEALTIEAVRELLSEIEGLKARLDKASRQQQVARRPRTKKATKEKAS